MKLLNSSLEGGNSSGGGGQDPDASVGRVWDPRRAPSSNWQSVAWNPDIATFAAVSANESLITSSDGGRLWDAFEPDLSVRNRLILRDVTAAPAPHRFVAVGDYYSDVNSDYADKRGAIWVFNEDDGWQHIGFIDAYATVDLEPTSIVYVKSSELYFVACADRFYTSYDLANWTQTSLTRATIPPEAVTDWGPGALGSMAWSEPLGLLVATDTSASGRVVVWDVEADELSYVKVNGDRQLLAIAWSDALGRFVATGGEGLAVSVNGADWEWMNFPNRTLVDVCWADRPGLFVVASIDWAGRLVMLVSSDSFSWEYHPAGVQGSAAVCWSRELDRLLAISNDRFWVRGGSAINVSTSGGSAASIDRSASAVLSSDGRLLSADDPGRRSLVAWDATEQRLAYRPILPDSSVGLVWDLVWASGTNDVQGFSFDSVAYSAPLGMFVAVSSGGFATSPDGIEWVFYAGFGGNMTNPGQGAPVSVCWSPQLSIFVACGPTSTGDGSQTYASFWRSANGYDWSRVDVACPAPEEYVPRSVVWSPELSIFVAIGATPYGFLSPNGEDWIVVDLPGDGGWGLAWSPLRARFVATCSTPSSRVYTSEDGFDWTERSTVGEGLSHVGICWAAEIETFVAVGWDGSVVQSADGENWLPQTVYNGGVNPMCAVCWGPEAGRLVAVAEGGGGPIATSLGVGVGIPNRMSWTRIPHPGLYYDGSGGSDYFYSVCWAPEIATFVAVGTAIAVSGARRPRDPVELTPPASGGVASVAVPYVLSSVDGLPDDDYVGVPTIGGSGAGLTLGFRYGYEQRIVTASAGNYGVSVWGIGYVNQPDWAERVPGTMSVSVRYGFSGSHQPVTDGVDYTFQVLPGYPHPEWGDLVQIVMTQPTPPGVMWNFQANWIAESTSIKAVQYLQVNNAGAGYRVGNVVRSDLTLPNGDQPQIFFRVEDVT